MAMCCRHKWMGSEGRAEARNLVNIYAATAEIEPQAVLDQYAGQGFGAFKPALTELRVETAEAYPGSFCRAEGR